MKFDAIVSGEAFCFSQLSKDTFLVTGRHAEYIVYKRGIWRCADEIEWELVEELGAVIEEHLQPVH